MTRFTISLALALAATAAATSAGAQESGRAVANPQDPAAVRQVAEDYLREQLAVLPGQPVIKLDDIHTEYLAACDDLSAYMPANSRPRPRMSVAVRCGGPHTWNTFVQATVSVPGQYYVAARPINAGEAITAADVAPRDGDLVNLPPGAMTDTQGIVGMVASSRLVPGQVIKNTVVRSAGAIQRGQMVRINAHGAGFVVSSEGQAMENAAPGSMVQVKTASGQIVSGIVQNQGTVEVPL